ncbi:MAG: DNA helicase RecQ [Kiritimatiellaeota bacterium]|nr:DNA helicase RecQ [Kiritimatiellota bacterium]
MPDTLTQLLKHHFGFGSFRPRQEAIIREVLAGRDVFALLPTGGGKSLCFQLPALAFESGLTLVISPLIALMKDQVDALQAAGVPATFLNSTLSGDAAYRRAWGLRDGRYRLLYVAPERLMLHGFLDSLAQWDIRLVAIDEAHCISEWGHDFRPEYRQLAEVRQRFPNVPFMALTATATERVRGDIIGQLRLRDPGVHIASFNRPNLVYRVLPKRRAYDQLLDFLRHRSDDAGIVYCHSRKAAESLASRLCEDGIGARPYHAGLEAAERNANQELFLRDEVRVICATIAFGMGINKSNVRFVVHHDLPKNIESYYQETGRAGRDGLPAECLLLFSPGDAMKIIRFIEEKPDPDEQRVARAQLNDMVRYAEHPACRRARLLAYFGETYPRPDCGACDNCLGPRKTFDATLPAQKLLSCILRVHRHGGFNVGLGHIIDILVGADTEKIRSLGHAGLTTYGIGADLPRPEWLHIARELLRLGLLRQNAEKYNTLEMTETGHDILRQRATIMLAEPVAATSQSKPAVAVGDIPCDDLLFKCLRELRKRLADERDVPAYVIFSDATLRHIARAYPADDAEFLRVPGVGQRKLDNFGAAFLAEIAAHLATHPRQTFAALPAAAPPPRRRSIGDSVRETLRQYRAGETPDAIAQARNLALATVPSHLAEAIECGEPIGLAPFFTVAELAAVAAAFNRHGTAALAPIHEALSGAIDYGRLRLFRAAAAKVSR